MSSEDNDSLSSDDDSPHSSTLSLESPPPSVTICIDSFPPPDFVASLPSRTWACGAQYFVLELYIDQYIYRRDKHDLLRFWDEPLQQCKAIIENPLVHPALKKTPAGKDAIVPSLTQLKNWFRNKTRGQREPTDGAKVFKYLLSTAQFPEHRPRAPSLLETYQRMYKDKISRGLQDHFIANKISQDDQRRMFIELNNRVRGDLYAQEPSHIKAEVEKQYAEDSSEFEKSKAEARIPDAGKPVSYGSHANYVKAVPKLVNDFFKFLHRDTGLVFTALIGGVMTLDGGIDSCPWIHVGGEPVSSDPQSLEYYLQRLEHDYRTAYPKFLESIIGSEQRSAIRQQWLYSTGTPGAKINDLNLPVPSDNPKFRQTLKRKAKVEDQPNRDGSMHTVFSLDEFPLEAGFQPNFARARTCYDITFGHQELKRRRLQV